MMTPPPHRPTLRARPVPVKPYRWRFPAGSVSQTADGLFRWERTEDHPVHPGRFRLLSGDLDLVDGVGYLQPADKELTLVRDPMPDWNSWLPAFPFCHHFFDPEVRGSEGADFGPWFCLCGVWRTSLVSVRDECVRGRQRTSRTVSI